ncbi:hypothetical protein ACIPSA_27955 [Streptomyces sp. NPDC086549]|uniref:hypothetical protein n=1 Tax=Streptomyces sp. NPDC086549 TaxID=3365752 RepID=UPI0037FE11D3
MAFTMPDGPVTLRLDTSEILDKAGLAVSPDGRAEPATLKRGKLFDRLSYSFTFTGYACASPPGAIDHPMHLHRYRAGDLAQRQGGHRRFGASPLARGTVHS